MKLSSISNKTYLTIGLYLEQLLELLSPAGFGKGDGIERDERAERGQEKVSLTLSCFLICVFHVLIYFGTFCQFSLK